jgi:ankyrin repeat protein
MLKDEAGNNAFHLAAKEGNIEMAKNLLKVVTPRNSLKLLSDKNNVHRRSFS